MRDSHTKIYAVYSLIKSLSKGERANLSVLNTIRAKKSIYSTLLQEIEGMRRWDTAFSEKVIKEKGLSKRQLTDSANYLFNLLINNIRSLGKSSNSDLLLLIESTEILIDLGLFFQAQKIISTGKEKALNIENFPLASQFIEYELKILETDELRATRIRAWEKILNEQDFITDSQKEIVKYQRLYIRALAGLEERWRIKDERYFETSPTVLASQILENPELSPDYTPKSKTAQILKQSTLQTVYRSLGNNPKAFGALKSTLELFNSEDALKRCNGRIYSKTLFIGAIFQSELGDIVGFNSLLNELIEFRKDQKKKDSSLEYQILTLEIYKILTEKDWQNLPKKIKEIESNFQSLANLAKPQIVSLVMLLVVALHNSGNYSLGITWISKVSGDLFSVFSFRVQFILRVSHILFLLELGYGDLAKSKLDALARVLSRKEAKPKGWKGLKKFLNGYCSLPPMGSKQKLFRELTNNPEFHAICSTLRPLEFKNYCEANADGKTDW